MQISVLVRWSVLATLAVTSVVGCGVAGDDEPDEPAAAPSVDSPVGSTTPTSSAPEPDASPTRSPPSGSPTTAADPADLGPTGVEVTVPPAGIEASGPVVVLVHGGGWVAGSPALMADWARELAAAGSVVYNASYRLATAPGGGYPGSIDDVACAVRFARATASEHTASTELVIMGHSAGGHLAAVVALNQDAYGAGCPYPAAEPPDQFVGLAGVYDLRRIGFLFDGWMGGSPTERPEAWRAANPVQLAAERDDLDVVLVTGSEDDVVPAAEVEAFVAVLGGNQLVREVVTGADHAALLRPAVVGLATLHLTD